MNPKTFNASRRLFLRQTSAMSMLGTAAAPLAFNLAAMGSAAAQTAGDYKALVCIFLFGGNDSYNTVLSTDSASWQSYTATRNQAPDSIALLAPGVAADGNAALGSPARLGGVLPLTLAAGTNLQGKTLGLHPLLSPMAALFNTDRRLAIVANVGPLRMPTTKAQYASSTHPKPASLFSHNDQQNTWQSFAPEGATLGWGGRMADLIASQNTNSMFTAISVSGNSVWLSGQTTRQYQVSGNGAIRMGPRPGDGDRTFDQTEVTQALEQVVQRTRGTHVLQQDMAAVAKRSLEAERVLRGVLPLASDPAFGTPVSSGSYNPQNDPKLRYVDPTSATGATAFNSLAHQLQVVARMVQAGASAGIGAKRQVFFVSLGGFDTHDTQNRNHAKLLAQLGHGLSYFDATLGSLGARDKVTAFTASDFGRTFTSNGDGTDHGWGAHHVVMGGAVRGGNVVGRWPTLGVKNANNNAFDSSPDQLDNGSLLPTTSTDQYAATLARWFGVSDSDALSLFPNLSQFDAAQRNLGLFGA
jgi:uncharacterized protein (DUF1501 family)